MMLDDIDLKIILFNKCNTIAFYNKTDNLWLYSLAVPNKPENIYRWTHLDDIVSNYLENDTNRGIHVDEDMYRRMDKERYVMEINVYLSKRQDFSIGGCVYYNGKIIHIAEIWKFMHTYIDDDFIAENIQLYAEHLSNIIKHIVIFESNSAK